MISGTEQAYPLGLVGEKQNFLNGDKKVKFLNNHQTPYFIFYNNLRCHRVTKQQFKDCIYPCFVFGQYKIKYNTATGTRNNYKTLFISVINTIADRLCLQDRPGVLHQVKEYVMKAVMLVKKIIDSVNAVAQAMQNKALLNWLFDVVLTLMDMVSRPIVSGIQMVIIMLRILRIYNDCPMRVQSIQSFLLSIAALGLPDKVVDAIRRITLFSNIKIADDFSFIFTIIKFFTEKFSVLLGKFGIDITYFGGVMSIWESIFQHYSILQEIDSVEAKWIRDKKILAQQEIQQLIIDLADKAKNNITLQEWARTSASISSRLQCLVKLHKLVLSYRNVTRQEPLCIAFEGPAGCFKSTLMAKMVTVLGKSVYSHEIKSLMDGKDFYDQYDNQDVMLLDDLGQGGPSQYRCLFNLISPVKHPLDCANEKLKDTKFFTSEAVLFTTNHFTKLHDYSKADGITDIHALWRRVLVCDFSRVQRIGNKLTGKVVLLNYNLIHKYYEPHQPVAFHSADINLGPEYCFDKDDITENENGFLVWASRWYNYKIAEREKFKENNAISEDRLKHLRDLVMQAVPGSPETVQERRERAIAFVQHLAQPAPAPDNAIHTFMINQAREVIPEAHQTWFSRGAAFVAETTLWEKIYLVSSVLLLFLNLWTALECFLEWYHKDDMRVQSIQELKMQSVRTTTMNETLALQTFFVDFNKKDDTTQTAVGVLSGHYVICPLHAGTGSKYISVRSKVEGCRLLDHAPVVEVYSSEKDDVLVLKIDEAIMVPFKKLNKVLRYNNTAHNSKTLVTPVGALPLLPFTAPAVASMITIHGKNKILDQSNSIAYKYSFDGLCGSLLINDNCGVIGSHIAGNDNYGRAILWSPETIDDVVELLDKDRFLLAENIKESNISSGIKLDKNYHQQTPKESKIVPSPLYGVFENYKQPSDLSLYGNHTVKDIAKKSFNKIEDVPNSILEFGKDYIESIIPEFGILNEEETVKGFENVARIDMTTATGINCDKDRRKYINYEEGVFTPLLKEEINRLRRNILDDATVELDIWIAKETLKDETRAITKNGEPRSFRVLRFPVNIVCKQLTGKMVSSLMKDKFNHGIMVGINPYTEWDRLYDHLMFKSKGLIAADIKKYDGNMLAQVQYLVRDVLVANLQSSFEDKQVLKYILTSFIVNPVAVNDDVYLTTHSMPSGCYLTAIMNSLVHKCYTAMWYKFCIPTGTLHSFNEDIFDAVYGDDKICSVRNNHGLLNALTMRDFFQSIGLDLSTADKKVITEPFDDPKVVNFLKRKFTYHAKLEKIMPELVEDSLLSSIQWVDTSKDFDAAMSGKINSFLIEAYLTSRYEFLRTELLERLADKGINYPIFSTKMIFSMLKRGEVDSPYNF